MEAWITDIKRMAVHDGDGIRTTVFFKGCPLRCLWCHNPESLHPEPVIGYYENKCIGCGECLAVCKSSAHRLTEGKHIFLREHCSACGECERVCLGEALKIYGKKYTVDALLPMLLEDKSFYDASGGGVTLSGGECLCQADFCAALLRALKEQNIHTAVDTCGFVPRESIDRVLPYTDTFLYDIKAIDEKVHIQCTGRSNRLILENLRYIDTKNKAIEIRIPYAPGYNSQEMEKIAAFTATLKNVQKVRILPLHNYAGSKYAALGMENHTPSLLPTTGEIRAAEALFPAG